MSFDRGTPPIVSLAINHTRNASPLALHPDRTSKGWAVSYLRVACVQRLTFLHDPTESPQQRFAAGEVAERPIAPVLKTGVPVRVPRVRIPASPLGREGVFETPSLASFCRIIMSLHLEIVLDLC